MKKQMRERQYRRRNRMLWFIVLVAIVMVPSAVVAITVVTAKTQPALPGVVIDTPQSETCIGFEPPLRFCYET